MHRLSRFESGGFRMNYICHGCQRSVDWAVEGSIRVIENHPMEDSEQFTYCSYKCLRD